MSTQKLVVALGIAYLVIKKRNQRMRAKYVREIFKKRNKLGEFQLVRELSNDAEYHFRYFRMSRQNFEEILTLVGPMLMHSNNHQTPISPEERLALTIRYLSSGNSQISMGFNYKISPSAVTKILRETLSAIWEVMAKIYVPSPNPESYKTCSEDYLQKWNFPHCVGSVDGKHVKIKAPSKTGSDFFNYKGYFSIVLLAVADANYKFSFVDIGAKGSQSDSGILANTQFGKLLYAGKLPLPPDDFLPNTAVKSPYVFLGDEGFPLKRNLMRPYPRKNLTLEQRIFNYRLCRGRRIIENTFGLWAARFGIYFSTIHADLDLAELIVKSTVVLHNFLMCKKDLGKFTTDREENGRLIEGNWRSIVRDDTAIQDAVRTSSNNQGRTSAAVRKNFKNYFNSEDGMIEWQYEATNTM